MAVAAPLLRIDNSSRSLETVDRALSCEFSTLIKSLPLYYNLRFGFARTFDDSDVSIF